MVNIYLIVDIEDRPDISRPEESIGIHLNVFFGEEILFEQEFHLPLHLLNEVDVRLCCASSVTVTKRTLIRRVNLRDLSPLALSMYLMISFNSAVVAGLASARCSMASYSAQILRSSKADRRIVGATGGRTFDIPCDNH